MIELISRVDATCPGSLHIIGSRKSGGAERFFLRLTGALANLAKVATLTPGSSDLNRQLSASIRHFHAPLAGVWDLWSRHLIHKAIREFQPAIVQTYMGRATRLTSLPRQGIPVHVARLGGYYNLKGYRHAHAWIGNTRGICDYMVREGLPHERVFHIGNFVGVPPILGRDRLSSQRGILGIPADACVILGLGRLHPNKGFSDLLAAFARLPSEIGGRPLVLAMVGDGPLRNVLKRQAEEQGIAARVIWAGWQTDPAPYYQLADLFVCSSRHEPLGNVILEAWANEVPVVSTRSEGPLELVEDGVDAILAEKANPDDLARAMEQALEMGDLARGGMVGAGRRKLDENFSETAIVDAYRGLYRHLAGG